MLGNDQPLYQPLERIKEISMNLGYKFQLTKLMGNEQQTLLEFKNIGIAPYYGEAHPSLNGVKSKKSLKGLLPGESRIFLFPEPFKKQSITIVSPRLLPGQKIDFLADL